MLYAVWIRNEFCALQLFVTFNGIFRIYWIRLSWFLSYFLWHILMDLVCPCLVLMSMDILKNKNNWYFFFENYCDVMNMNKHLNCAKWIIKHDAVCIINIISSFWKMIQFVQWERFVCIDTDYRIDTKKIQYFRLSPPFFRKNSPNRKKIAIAKALGDEQQLSVFWSGFISASFLLYSLIASH